MTDLTQFATEADLTDGHHIVTQRLARQRRRNSQRQCGISTGVEHPRSTDRKGVNVIGADLETATAFEYGKQHGEPARVDPLGGTARIAETRLGDQRLNLDEEWAVAIDGGHDSRAADAGHSVGQKKPTRVCDRCEAIRIHLQ